MKSGNVAMRNKRVLILLIVIAVSLVSFIGGVMAASMPEMLLPVFERTDVEWAQDKGFMSGSIKEEGNPTQAEFLQMVVKVFGSEIKGGMVPKGAENHWASKVYATAKAEGMIDCSCQIKPDQSITTKEAAKFILLALNGKAKKQITSLEEVQGWIERKADEKTPVTYQDGAKMIRKMHELMESYHLRGV